MEEKVKKALLLAGFGVSLSASAGILYYLLKREETTEINLKSLKTMTSRQSVIRLKIPKELVGAIIGRQGSVISELQKKTNTRIRFDNEGECKSDESDRVLVIRGSPENAQDAETLVHELLKAQAEIITEEIFVPVRACGRIIGRNGETIRHMSVISNAKITLDRGGNERDPDNMKRITIRGSKKEISTAISLIDEKLAEEDARRNKIISSSGQPNRYSRNRLAINFHSENDPERNQGMFSQERLEVHSTDGFLEVYISGVENPGRFWVQIVGPKSVELDKLVEDMTQHYQEEHNRLPVPDNIQVGDVVAAPFHQDKNWYRGLIEEIEVDEYSLAESKAQIFFLDFGDNDFLPLRSLSILKSEYEVLPFQGIECCLAHVTPDFERKKSNVNRGKSPAKSSASDNCSEVSPGCSDQILTKEFIDNSEERASLLNVAKLQNNDTGNNGYFGENKFWSEEAIEMFEKLTYTAQWRVMMAKPISLFVKTVAKRKRNVYYVELVDTNARRDVHVGKELVKLGYALWDETQIGSVMTD